jgi:molecular chaperone DnaK
MPIQIEASFQGVSSPETKSKPIVGIDLGTTHSLVAIVRDGQPQVLVSPLGQRLVPSVVSLKEGVAFPVIGWEAKSNKVRDAKHTVFSVKRLLGRSYEDLKAIAHTLPYEIVPHSEGVVRVQLGEHSFTAIEISAMILRELKQIAEQALGEEVTQAVITVPAYFNDAQRQATRTAGRLAGLDVLRMINEPTAASLAYGLDKKRQGLIAVYDLGGGTFDFSLLKLHDGIFEVLATRGDTQLGGDDLDQAIAQKMAQVIHSRLGIDPYQDLKTKAALLECAEEVKKVLSENTSAHFKVDLPELGVFEYAWSLEEFEALVRPILARTYEPCIKALQDAGLSVSDLSDVVLVGGPTRLGIVKKMAEEIFGMKPNTSVHPDEVVAQGAAIQADILSGKNRDLLLLDVVPLSLGIETHGGLMSTLIPRNTRIPTVAREQYTTGVDRQTAVDIHVLQGERERVEENRSLARFKLKGIEPLPAGMPRIEVTFLIDADGILQVSAKDLRLGHEQSIEVKPTYGLTDQEVERMLQSGLDFAQKDEEYRHLVEARRKAEPVVKAVEKSWDDAKSLLAPEELEQVKKSLNRLKQAVKADSPQEIIEATSELNQRTVRLAELLIRDTLKSSQNS